MAVENPMSEFFWERRACLGAMLSAAVLPYASFAAAADNNQTGKNQADGLQMGIAQVEITPPLGYPMAGYFHERLADSTKDPLWAKAVVFRNGETQAAWVTCDILNITTDLTNLVRKRAAERTGIPVENILIASTHSHTAPHYYHSLYLYLGPDSEIKTDQDRERVQYIATLIDGIIESIVKAQAAAGPVTLESGTTQQEHQVSFCRRTVMKDGSVSTWVGLKHPNAVRLTAPIDPEITLLKVTPRGQEKPLGLISNFALHLDTLGGLGWSGDFPYFIEQTVQKTLGSDVLSVYATGACGDINHADPTGKPRQKTPEIGQSLGNTIVAALNGLQPVQNTNLQVRTTTVQFPLQEVTPQQTLEGLKVVRSVLDGAKVPLYENIAARNSVILDWMRNKQPTVDATDIGALRLSRNFQGIGETLPIEVSTITIGSEVAFVFLPAEVFVELGLAIKNASPFPNTTIVTFSQSVEAGYIPNQQAYPGGGYEVANCRVKSGSGEMLVEAAVRLLRESATADIAHSQKS